PHRELRSFPTLRSSDLIGQAAEFDYAGTEACLALKEAGIEDVLLNINPATIMTDETVADHVYLEPMSLVTLEKMIKKERPDGMIDRKSTRLNSSHVTIS